MTTIIISPYLLFRKVILKWIHRKSRRKQYSSKKNHYLSYKVNEASQAICLRKPSMLRRRGELLVQAKQRVHDTGYVYRKGKSRSKSYGSVVDDATRPKRVKTSADERISRMKTIKEELSDLQNRVSFKRKRLDAAEVTKNYKLCDQLSEEIADLNKSKRLLEVELDMLQKKEKKSKKVLPT